MAAIKVRGVQKTVTDGATISRRDPGQAGATEVAIGTSLAEGDELRVGLPIVQVALACHSPREATILIEGGPQGPTELVIGQVPRQLRGITYYRVLPSPARSSGKGTVERLFRLLAGPDEAEVPIAVEGTAFSVETREDGSCEVFVPEGVVAIGEPGRPETRRVEAGHSALRTASGITVKEASRTVQMRRVEDVLELRVDDESRTRQEYLLQLPGQLEHLKVERRRTAELTVFSGGADALARKVEAYRTAGMQALDGSNPRQLRLVAEEFARQGDDEQAQSLFERAASLGAVGSEQSASLRAAAARCAMRRGEYASAERFLLSVPRSQANHPEVLTALIALYTEPSWRPQLAKAEEIQKRLRKAHETRAGSADASAVAAMHVGRYADAVDQFVRGAESAAATKHIEDAAGMYLTAGLLSRLLGEDDDNSNRYFAQAKRIALERLYTEEVVAAHVLPALLDLILAVASEPEREATVLADGQASASDVRTAKEQRLNVLGQALKNELDVVEKRSARWPIDAQVRWAILRAQLLVLSATLEDSPAGDNSAAAAVRSAETLLARESAAGHRYLGDLVTVCSLYRDDSLERHRCGRGAEALLRPRARSGDSHLEDFARMCQLYLGDAATEEGCTRDAVELIRTRLSHKGLPEGRRPVMERILWRGELRVAGLLLSRGGIRGLEEQVGAMRRQLTALPPAAETRLNVERAIASLLLASGRRHAARWAFEQAQVTFARLPQSTDDRYGVSPMGMQLASAELLLQDGAAGESFAALERAWDAFRAAQPCVRDQVDSAWARREILAALAREFAWGRSEDARGDTHAEATSWGEVCPSLEDRFLLPFGLDPRLDGALDSIAADPADTAMARGSLLEALLALPDRVLGPTVLLPSEQAGELRSPVDLSVSESALGLAVEIVEAVNERGTKRVTPTLEAEDFDKLLSAGESRLLLGLHPGISSALASDALRDLRDLVRQALVMDAPSQADVAAARAQGELPEVGTAFVDSEVLRRLHALTGVPIYWAEPQEQVKYFEAVLNAVSTAAHKAIGEARTDDWTATEVEVRTGLAAALQRAGRQTDAIGQGRTVLRDIRLSAPGSAKEGALRRLVPALVSLSETLRRTGDLVLAQDALAEAYGRVVLPGVSWSRMDLLDTLGPACCSAERTTEVGLRAPPACDEALETAWNRLDASGGYLGFAERMLLSSHSLSKAADGWEGRCPRTAAKARAVAATLATTREVPASRSSADEAPATAAPRSRPVERAWADCGPASDVAELASRCAELHRAALTEGRSDEAGTYLEDVASLVGEDRLGLARWDRTLGTLVDGPLPTGASASRLVDPFEKLVAMAQKDAQSDRTWGVVGIQQAVGMLRVRLAEVLLASGSSAEAERAAGLGLVDVADAAGRYAPADPEDQERLAWALDVMAASVAAPAPALARQLRGEASRIRSHAGPTPLSEPDDAPPVLRALPADTRPGASGPQGRAM